MTAADLLAYVGTDGIGPTDAETTFAGACWAQAAALVAQHVGGELVTLETVGTPQVYTTGEVSTGITPDPTVISATVPEAILRRATLEVGAELFHRRSTKNGVSQFASPDSGAAIRIARDPMVAAYPLLAPYVGRGIA